MEGLFKEMLGLYADFAEKARQHREKVSLLQQNVEQFQHEKVEKMVQAEKSDFASYVEKQQKQAQEIATSILDIASKRDADFDVSDLSGIFGYLQATQARADYKVVEGQIEKYRGVPTAISSIYAVAQNNSCPPEVKGVIKACACDLDEIGEKLSRNVHRVFQQLSDCGEAGRTLCNIAATLGVDIENTIEDTEGAAYIFRKFAGLI